jgi:hypothetical protein
MHLRACLKEEEGKELDRLRFQQNQRKHASKRKSFLAVLRPPALIFLYAFGRLAFSFCVLYHIAHKSGRFVVVMH